MPPLRKQRWGEWQIWGRPGGRLVWIPVPPPMPPRGSLLRPTTVDGGRVQSMADILLQSRNELVEGDKMAGDAWKGGLFRTASGNSVSVSERAIQRARTLVLEETSNNTSGIHKGSMFSMFQTGSGKAVSLSKDSIQKAGGVLRDVDTAACAIQPMFCTGMDRSIPVRRISVDKARAVLEGQTVARQGHEGVDVMGKFPLFQTGSGRAVSVSASSFQKAKAVLEEDNIHEGYMEGFGKPHQSPVFQSGSGTLPLVRERSMERSRTVLKEGGFENSGQWDDNHQFPMFQTGLGMHVAVSESSVRKAMTVLEEEKSKRNGYGDTNVCATTIQTETPRSVLMSGSLIMNDRSATPEGDFAMREKYHEGNGPSPLFQTGLRRSVSVGQSPFKRETAILEPRNIAKELEDEAHFDGGNGNPVFKTGVGRSIIASENSRKEVQVVLEAEEAVKSVKNDTGEDFGEEAICQAGMRNFVAHNRSSCANPNIRLEQGNYAARGYKCGGGQLPMFQTGSGKSVLISETSVQKARAVLEEEGDINRDNHKMCNKMDKKFPVFASPLKTSCARTVNISSAGVSRAATLLGLEESTLSTQFFGHVGEKLGTKITVERENSEHRLGVASAHGISGSCPRSSCPTENRMLTDPQTFGFYKNAAPYAGERPIRFSTAGGRSLAISSDTLQRAKSLLGESDIGVSTDNIVDHSFASACKEKLPHLTITPKDGLNLSKINGAMGKTESTTFSHQAMLDRKPSGSFGYAVPNTPLTDRGTNMFQARREFQSINEIPKIPKPSSKNLCETYNASNTPDMTRRVHMPTGGLVDITNHVGTHSVNVDNVANEKRRIWGRNSVSPFKRPRCSR